MSSLELDAILSSLELDAIPNNKTLFQIIYLKDYISVNTWYMVFLYCTPSMLHSFIINYF